MRGDIELYVNMETFANGSFHKVSECLQRREFVKEMKNGRIIKYVERMLTPPKKWAIKKVINKDHTEQVIYDIAKQYMAMILA